MIKFIKPRHLALAALTFGALAAGSVLAEDSSSAPADEAGSAPAEETGSDLAPLTFTSAQAIGGGVNFQRNCAACHGNELEGGAGPSLSGRAFSGRVGQPVLELHNFIQSQMPPGQSNSLSDAQVSTIIAFLASRNGMVAGDEAIPTDSAELEGIMFGQ